jgi:isopenicillin-N epimerase
VSWGWQPETNTLLSLDSSGKAASPFILEQEWQGTRDISAYLSVPAAIEFQAEYGWDNVRAQCHELLRELRVVPFLKPVSPDSTEWYVQMAAFELPACDAAELKRRLYDDYHIEVPIIEWGGRQFVRVSVQGYNTRGDVEALVEALRALLPET